MALKDLAVPALCVLGTLYFIKGCNEGKRGTPVRTQEEPTPICQEVPVQECPDVIYQGDFEPQVQTRIIHRRITRRTIRTTTTTTPIYYYEY